MPQVGDTIRVYAGWLKPRETPPDVGCIIWRTYEYGYWPEERGDDEIKAGIVTRVHLFLETRVYLWAVIEGKEYSLTGPMLLDG